MQYFEQRIVRHEKSLTGNLYISELLFKLTLATNMMIILKIEQGNGDL